MTHLLGSFYLSMGAGMGGRKMAILLPLHFRSFGSVSVICRARKNQSEIYSAGKIGRDGKYHVSRVCD